MKTERWAKVAQVLQSAREREPGQRPAFLDEACADDESLRREVEVLLSSHDQAGSFLETPPSELASELLADERSQAMTGQRIGPFQVISHLGSGGMGDVYRAIDTRLDRTVAIKFLPPRFSQDSELRQRLEREARTISRLNHPNICTLYDMGRHDDIDYLVMEYLEGETLADRLSTGALPLDQALRYAIEIADALHTAHRHGIIHRDIKPDNIMLVKSGSKLLDFGLAKFNVRSASPTSQTLATAAASRQTMKGTILGTVLYMAPEQLEGNDADSRTDIFAFGAVIYEMITGRRAFEGKSQASLIAAIMSSEPPPISTIHPMAPKALDRLIRSCLVRDPEERWQSALDVKRELEWIAEGAPFSEPEVRPPQASLRIRNRLPWSVAAISIVATLLLGAMLVRPKGPANYQAARFFISASPGTVLAPSYKYGAPAVSPDGSQIVFEVTKDAQTLLYVRPVNSLEARPLIGTENAYHPFWKPDSRSIGFFADGNLKTVGLTGGSPMTLCPAGDRDSNQGKGGTWNRDGDIVFATTRAQPLYRVSESGGTPEQITMLDPSGREESHRWPYFLPDGRHFLYFARSPGGSGGKGTVWVASLDSKEKTRLFEHTSNVVYAPPGYLLFVKNEDLMAQPFDAKKLRITGVPIRVAESVAVADLISRAVFSVSENGVLTFSDTGAADLTSQMMRYSHKGDPLESIGPATPYLDLRVAPDGKSIAYSRLGSQFSSKLWLMNLMSGGQSSFNAEMDLPATNSPVWFHDGNQIVFASRSENSPLKMYRTSLRGTGKPQLLSELEGYQLNPMDISRDGKYLLLKATGYLQPNSKAALRLAQLSPGGQLQTYLDVPPFIGKEGRFSPDGHWVVYESSESNREEVYVRASPSAQNRILISTAGGTSPMWNVDGKEIVYLSLDRNLMSVPVESDGGPELKHGTPRILFKAPGARVIGEAGVPWWDMSPDGQYFYFAVAAPPSPFTAVLNWTAELKH